MEDSKIKFVSAVYQELERIPGVQSVTFTGSFVDKSGLVGISDIDVIVIVETLDERLFVECKSTIESLSPNLLGLSDHRVLVNDTFGPLKLDEAGVVVVHLMIYDLPGHREHVLKSPFTCLDWQRSTCHQGRSLQNIFPVLPLQPRQFFEARRSLKNYLEDITTGTISYRRHYFGGAHRTEITERLPLDRRHQGEYAFHIVRNLVLNYSKLILKQNQLMAEEEFANFWKAHLPGCANFIDWFMTLSAIKKARRSDFPDDTVQQTEKFLAAFAQELEQTWTLRATRHVFVRHARTRLNDGTFLGQGRDPSIDEWPPPLPALFSHVFTSPAARCQETAAALAPTRQAIVDSRLHEIDYGSAEGIDLATLAGRHPDMILQWQRGGDPVFPNGENTAAVTARLRSFLASLPGTPTLVVSHNVFIRCLLGEGLALPSSCWHHLPVSHLEQVEILSLGGEYYLNLTAQQIEKISDAIAGKIS